MDIAITYAIIIIISILAVYIAKKVKIPSVVSLIFVGIFFGVQSIRSIVIGPNEGFVLALGDIALISLMFLTGIESSWNTIYKEKTDAAYIAFFSALVPFLMGFIIIKVMGFSTYIAFIVGVCMSISAEATKAQLLIDLNKLKTKVGSAMIGAGILDDALGFAAFAAVTYTLSEVATADYIIMGGAILAFFVGVVTHNFLGKNHIVIKSLESILMILVVPFFFISMGLHFELHTIYTSPLLLIVIIFLAIVGKLFGALLTKKLTKFSYQQLYLIGWGMNSRGAIELALALIAFKANLIPVEIYSVLVIMALVTTLIFPFIVTHLIKKHPKIMG